MEKVHVCSAMEMFAQFLFALELFLKYFKSAFTPHYFDMMFLFVKVTKPNMFMWHDSSVDEQRLLNMF